MKQTQTVHDFALIGHPGAGKTCLVAGLFKAVGEKFVAIPDADTEAYVKNACIALESGESWPDASQGAPRKLGYTVQGRRQYHLRFNDYPGEMISDPKFLNEVVKKPDGSFPDGVLLMINCAASQLDDLKQKNDMEADLKKFIAILSGNHVPVALVITAWDRMVTDRKDRRVEFEKFLRPMIKILKLNKCKWKRFNVSVTGKLEEQSHPKLNPSNVERPFVWLIDPRPPKWIKMAICAILAILLLAVCICKPWETRGKIKSEPEGEKPIGEKQIVKEVLPPIKRQPPGPNGIRKGPDDIKKDIEDMTLI